MCLFFLLGCVENPPENPETLSFSYSSGAMHLDWGSYEVNVEPSGNGTLIKKMGMSMELQKTFSLSQGEMKEVFDTASKNGFFSLNDSYDDPFIMDGGWSRISISTDSSTKTVSMSNYSLQQFSAVESKIISLVTNKLGANAFSLSDFKNYCPTKLAECSSIGTECGSKECYDCEEWIYFCE